MQQESAIPCSTVLNRLEGAYVFSNPWPGRRLCVTSLPVASAFFASVVQRYPLCVYLCHDGLVLDGVEGAGGADLMG